MTRRIGEITMRSSATEARTKWPVEITSSRMRPDEERAARVLDLLRGVRFLTGPRTTISFASSLPAWVTIPELETAIEVLVKSGEWVKAGYRSGYGVAYAPVHVVARPWRDHTRATERWE